MKKLLLLLVKGYQLSVRPFLGHHCRFYPSCSEYAAEALKKHGACKGSWLAIRRLSKCHPWHEGGIDCVPDNTPPNLS